MDAIGVVSEQVSPSRFAGPSAVALRWSAGGLVLGAMFSAFLFGLYILAHYVGAAADGDMEEWNAVLPRLYEAGTPVANASIGLHFATGGVILVLGGVQLIGRLRARFPAVHRWIGRVYVTAAFLSGLGGLAFIAAKGTVGGGFMNVGFTLYGLLTVLAAVETFRHAAARRLDRHRAWAIRLFALAIGSWLYRMEYGLWLTLTDGLGHAAEFSGPFDKIMPFFFWVPNLLLAEAFIRTRRIAASAALRFAGAGAMLAATALVAIGTFYFAKFYWGPAILHRLAGLAG